MPLISIVIPCFNAERWIRAAIESALCQTHDQVEVIVVNDGSTDGSIGIISEFGDRLLVFDGPNRGVCAARNTGLCMASGDWVQFLDADDLLHPRKVELSLQCFASMPSTSFVWSPLLKVEQEFSLGDSVVGRGASEEACAAEPRGKLELNALRAPYAPATALFQRGFLDKVGLWDETLRRWTDLEYHARIAAYCPEFVSMSDPMYFYRQHDGPRISAANMDFKQLEDGRRALRLAHTVLKKTWPDQFEIARYFAPFYLNLARSAAANGDGAQFRELLTEADRLRGERRFHLKCQLVLACASVIGPTATSVLIEQALRTRAQSPASRLRV